MKVASTTSKTDEIATASGSLRTVGINQTLIKSRDYVLCDRTQPLSAPSVAGERREKCISAEIQESWKIL